MLLLTRGRRKVGVLGRSRVERSVFLGTPREHLWAFEESNITRIPTPPTYLYGLGRRVKTPGQVRTICEHFLSSTVQHGAT